MGTTMRETARRLLEGQVLDLNLDLAEAQYVEFGKARVPGAVEAMPNALELVMSLSMRMPVAVASNSPREVLSLVLEEIGVLNHLRGFVAGNDVAEGKPKPEIYLKSVAITGCLPSEILVFEDSVTGMEAARSAGCDVLHVGVDPHHKDKMAIAGVPNLPVSYARLEELLSSL
jgi:HAD superfamily hydrolase (TIGR01509 family)